LRWGDHAIYDDPDGDDGQVISNLHNLFYEKRQYTYIQSTMSVVSKTITLRVPSNIIYLALKDTRLEKLFPEFFIGISRKLVIDKENKQITFRTSTQDSQIEIIENFRIKISGNNNTQVDYITETNVEEGNLVVESIVLTHIANILYALLMLEVGYINGVMEKAL
jgi:hypothetical protein